MWLGIAAVAAIAALRLAYVSVWVIGGGESYASPSGRYLASAMSYEGRHYFGGPDHWVELSVENHRGKRIWGAVVRPEAHACDWRAHGALTWSADSSHAVFRCEDPTTGAVFELASTRVTAQPTLDEAVEELTE